MTTTAAGRYLAVPPTLGDGNAQDLGLDGAGNLRTTLGIQRVTAIPSTAFNTATTTNSADLTASTGRGLILYIDVTAWTAAGTSTTVSLQAKFGSDYLTIYTLTPTIGAAGLQAFVFYPGASSAGAWTAAPVQGVIPSVFRLSVVTVGAVNYTATYGIDFVN